LDAGRLQLRVLIIGASGFIGRHLVRRLSTEYGRAISGTFWSRTPPDDGNVWYQTDLMDPTALDQVFQSAGPDVVVHLAAVADIGTAERDPQRATAVNVVATSAIARLSEAGGARLVFISTECVFGGERGYYREDESPRPTTHYGRTKWEAEQEVAKLAFRWSTLRTSIVYGWPEPGRRNFAPWLIDRLGNGHSYNGAANVYRTPIYVEHLVDGIAKLVHGDYPGIHHVAGRDWVSMYHFASVIAQAFDLDRDLVIRTGLESGGDLGTDPPTDSTASANSDLLGLDSTQTMRRLELDHPSLAEGIEAMRARAPIP
jgi:dTDP-4-dehydrorhamnose reductase